MFDGVSALFLTTVLPAKKRMGSEVASQAIIDVLIDLGIAVTVAGYVRSKDKYALRPNEVCVGPRQIESKEAGLYPLAWLARSFALSLPYSLAKYVSRQYVSVVRKLLAENNYDLIILDHVQMSWLIEAVPFKCKVIGLAHNVEHQMYRSFVGDQKSGLRRWIYEREGRLIEKVEQAFVNQVDQLWALTKHDADTFASIKKNGEVREIALPASSNSVTDMTKKEFDIGLIGSWTWKANEQGLRWFFDEVYPYLPTNLSIRVAGNGAQWLTGKYTNVNYVGFVNDACSFLQQARVVAIPTLSGGGIQVKTLDAIASGSRVVATTLAVRGINDFPRTVDVVDAPTVFAKTLALSVTASESEAALFAEALQWSATRCANFRSTLEENIKACVQIS